MEGEVPCSNPCSIDSYDKGPVQDLVTCLYIFRLPVGWDSSVPAQKALESHFESVLEGRALVLFTSVSSVFFLM